MQCSEQFASATTDVDHTAYTLVVRERGNRLGENGTQRWVGRGGEVSGWPGRGAIEAALSVERLLPGFLPWDHGFRR